MKSFSPCILIPIYNNRTTIGDVVRQLEPLQLPCIIIDDGSDRETADAVDHLTAYSWVDAHHLPVNGGKGVALSHGFRLAYERNHTHAITIDADGQHCVADIPRFLAAAKACADGVVIGNPIFDENAPLGRVIGRKFSQLWVWIETLSCAIRDPLYGFRCYPIKKCLCVLDSCTIGQRMDFEPDIIIRLSWAGCPMVNLPTKVTYDPDGLSHFDLVRDNMRLSILFARHFFGMLVRLPQLLWHRLRRLSR